jgi:hypothetical protein
VARTAVMKNAASMPTANDAALPSRALMGSPYLRFRPATS